MSRYLSPRDQKGLIKMGEVVLGGPTAFSRIGPLNNVDRILEFMDPQDLKELKQLLNGFCFLPHIFIKLIFSFAHIFVHLPGKWGAPFRLFLTGTKGIIYTLYYSDPENDQGHLLHQIQYKVENNSNDTSKKKDQEMAKIIEQDYATGENRQKQKVTPLVMERAYFAANELKQLALKQKIHLLQRLKQNILLHADLICDVIQKEAKKSRTDAYMSEIFGVLDHLDFLIKKGAKLLAPKKVGTPIALMGKKSWIEYAPLGPVLVISAWNYPFFQAIIPISSALLAGNPVLFKPSELTPMKGLIEKLCSDSGIESHWVQVFYGDGNLGQELIELRPRKIFFIGSQRAGREVMASAAKYLIPVELEMGGKDAMVVFEDVHIERAVAGALWGGLTNNGQSCTSVEILYIHEKIKTPFVHLLNQEVNRLKVGIDKNGDRDLGLIISEKQVQHIQELVKDALEKGAKKLVGELNFTPDMRPLVLTDVNPEMRIFHEEIFGPVIVLDTFTDENEVIERINRSEFGLSASVWSKGLNRAKRVCSQLDVGNVSLNNVMLTEGNSALPFGGVKQSGFGRLKGETGLHSFCNIKSVLLDKDSKKLEANWYPFSIKRLYHFQEMTVGLFGKGLVNKAKFAKHGLQLEQLAQKKEH